MEQANLAAQNIAVPEDLAVEEVYARSILDPIDHPAGSHEHSQVLAAALISKWPQIRYMLAERARRR